jgi:uncharacterized protein (TIGR03083 family)
MLAQKLHPLIVQPVTPFVDRGELMAALEEYTDMSIMRLRAICPHESSTLVPGLGWTVGETVAHVLIVVRRMISDKRRSSSPADLARLNELCLAEQLERDPQRIADLLEADLHTVLTQIFPRTPDDLRFPFHAGVTTTIRPVMASLLGEFLLHEYDVARALGCRSPIESHMAALTWRGIVGLLPAWLRKDISASVNETYLIDPCDGRPPVALRIANRRLTVSLVDEPVGVGRHTDPTRHSAIDGADYVVRIDPGDLLLTFPYGRTPASDPALARLAAMFEPL